MEEPRVRNKRPIRRNKEEDADARSRKWILLLFMGFGLFCVIQALNLYLRISMETKNQHILQERDTLTQQRDTLMQQSDAFKQQRDTLKQKLQDMESLTSEGWQYFEGSWYLGSNTEQNWNESRKFCQEKGADLIIINSVQEQEFARMFYGNRWIGLRDLEQEGVWRWVDGSLLNISFWHPNEPNNKGSEHCGNMYYNVRPNNWNDDGCSKKLYCICEK